MLKLSLLLSICIALSCCGAKKKATTKTEGSVNSTLPTKNEAEVKTAVAEPDGIITTIKVIRVSCASIVAKITDDALIEKGEQWVPYNVRMVKPYKGAFSFMNHNDIVGKVKENYVFKAKLIATKDIKMEPEPRCAMEDFPPATVYYVKALTTPKEEQ